MLEEDKSMVCPSQGLGLTNTVPRWKTNCACCIVFKKSMTMHCLFEKEQSLFNDLRKRKQEYLRSLFVMKFKREKRHIIICYMLQSGSSHSMISE